MGEFEDEDNTGGSERERRRVRPSVSPATVPLSPTQNENLPSLTAQDV
jgi:hypothetical protein